MRRIFLEWCAILSLLLLLAGWLSFGKSESVAGQLFRIDAALYDFANRLAPIVADPRIAVVEIDEASLAQIGRWPWPRSVHAALLNKLKSAGARVVGIDILLAEAGRDDNILAAAIAENGPVVLPVTTEIDSTNRSWPVYPVRAIGRESRLGHAHFEFDRDGVVRGLNLEEGGLAAFSLEMLVAGSVEIEAAPANEALKLATEQRRREIFSKAIWSSSQFVLLPGIDQLVRGMSVAEVLRTELGKQFEGKTVLVGATAAGMHDSYANAIVAGHRISPGALLHVAAYSAIAQNRLLRRAPYATQLLLIGLIVGTTMLLLYRSSPRFGLLTVALAAVLTAAISILVLQFGYWLPPAGTLTALILAYPLWSWRRLESLVSGLIKQAGSLRQVPDALLQSTAGTDLMARVRPVYQRGRFGRFLPPVDPVENQLQDLRQAADWVGTLRLMLATVLEALPHAAVVCDKNGRPLIHNQVARNSFTNITAAGPNWHWLLEPFGDDPQLRRFFTSGEELQQTIYALERRDKQGRDWLIDSTGVQSTQLPPLWLFQFTNITEIRALQRQRESMMRFISHDLKSPQVSILSALEQIPKSEHNEWTKAIESHARNSLQLAESFVQWTRAESKALEEEPVDLAAVAMEAVDGAWILGGRGATPVSLQAPESAYTLGDPQLIRRALGNLIDNAIKYGGPNNRVTVQISAKPVQSPPGIGRYWLICVCDTGPGLVGVDAETMFEPYVRGQTQTDRSGTGLGLAFVRMVAQRHGGKADAQNRPQGGACFRIYLPISDTSD